MLQHSEKIEADTFKYWTDEQTSETLPVPYDHSETLPGYIWNNGTLLPWYRLEEIDPEAADHFFNKPEDRDIEDFHISRLILTENSTDYACIKLRERILKALNRYVDSNAIRIQFYTQLFFKPAEQFCQELESGQINGIPDLPLSEETFLCAFKQVLFHDWDHSREHFRSNPDTDFSEYSPLIPAAWEMGKLECPGDPSGGLDEIHYRIETITYAIREYKCALDGLAKDHFGKSAVAPTQNQFRIDAGNTGLRTITGKCWQALLQNNNPERLFLYAGKIARVSSKSTMPSIELLKRDHIRNELIEAAYFYKRSKKGDELEAYPANYLCDNLLVSKAPPLPKLSGLTFAPSFAANGKLHNTPGYSKDTGLFYVEQSGISPIADIPESPSADEVEQARALILGELLVDFPFGSSSDLAHAVALLILPFVRQMIDGPTPNHSIEAPAPGTGKTLLAETLISIYTGLPPNPCAEKRSDDEFTKLITSKLIEGVSHLFIDNVRRKIDSAPFASLLTARSWSDRILGFSETANLPVNCCFITTGNNTQMSTEIARRSIRIRIDSGIERPWQRKSDQFRHADLKKWAAANRPRLIHAVLTLVQNWIAQGQPQPSKGTVSFGMFEQWRGVIGGILRTNQIEGFLNNLSDFYETSDEESGTIKSLVGIWWEKYGGQTVVAGEVFDLAERYGIPLPVGEGKERSRRIKFGQLLQQYSHRWFDGLQLIPGEMIHGRRGWELRSES